MTSAHVKLKSCNIASARAPQSHKTKLARQTNTRKERNFSNDMVGIRPERPARTAAYQVRAPKKRRMPLVGLAIKREDTPIPVRLAANPVTDDVRSDHCKVRPVGPIAESVHNIRLSTHRADVR